MTRHAALVARLLLGLVFLVFGLNGFFHFLPMPPLADRPGAFMGALAATGYMFPLIKGTEVVAGALLLAGRFVPLALLLLAPVVVNIAAFHVFLTPGEVGMSLVLVALTAFLGWAYRGSFRGVLDPNAAPAPAPALAPDAVPSRA
jgi:uncharacterized membrane protein YphA (DoxX/SURF4 family)